MTVLRGSVICCVGLVLALARPSMAQESIAPLKGPPADDGLITIESDRQTADNVSGVVTAIGNVRIVYPSRGMVSTSRQAQYFSREGRLVLSGDVDVVQEDGSELRAERVTYDLEDERAVAVPLSGGQVRATMILRPSQPAQTPLTP
ncbi:lipopolysaccharide export system/ ATPase component [Synechococcus sp. BIOS-U3-1]|uniref:LptA/OstA family protein n=1 Tax=Synechococcus sp. BIOS-U3-1 TaxID=1400865 RepID=UPI001861BC9A|nr:lipopolysaccharide export system/ ATPase component [Synechococcus sp. BIOS-U3-1]